MNTKKRKFKICNNPLGLNKLKIKGSSDKKKHRIEANIAIVRNENY